MRGPLGFSVLGISPNFDSVFRFSHLKTAVFRFCCLARFAGFLQLVLVFGFCQQLGRVFAFFSPMHFTIFLVLPKKLQAAVALKL